jgi:hypothetical protein
MTNADGDGELDPRHSSENEDKVEAGGITPLNFG